MATWPWSLERKGRQWATIWISDGFYKFCSSDCYQLQILQVLWTKSCSWARCEGARNQAVEGHCFTAKLPFKSPCSSFQQEIGKHPKVEKNHWSTSWLWMSFPELKVAFCIMSQNNVSANSNIPVRQSENCPSKSLQPKFYLVGGFIFFLTKKPQEFEHLSSLKLSLKLRSIHKSWRLWGFLATTSEARRNLEGATGLGCRVFVQIGFL